MPSLSFCFILEYSHLCVAEEPVFEEEYKKSLRPLLQFLYANPAFCMAFALDGIRLNFLQEKHPECIEIMRQLAKRRQIELLGGGYYNPPFPLLLSQDRAGQIDMLSTKIRQLFGKRPHGAKLAAGIWDSSLVQTFYQSGISYTFLPEELFSEEKNQFVPLIMADKGKSLSLLPYNDSLKPKEAESAKAYITRIQKRLQKSAKKAEPYVQNANKAIFIRMASKELNALIDSGMLSDLLDFALKTDSKEINILTPWRYMNGEKTRLPIFIPAGISPEFGAWAKLAYTSVPHESARRTVYDFFITYPHLAHLYDRMTYVSQAINQYRGDKARKNTAREKLWQAQNAAFYVYNPEQDTFKLTSESYMRLTECEKILKEQNFTDSLIPMDYNCDGQTEYVFSMKDYTAVLQKNGGALREFNICRNTRNACETLSRKKEYDGISDGYTRGLFIDRLHDKEEFTEYLRREENTTSQLPNALYEEQHCSAVQKDVQLSYHFSYGKNAQPVLLKKKYVAYSSGMMIQYIIRNESQNVLRARFTTELNFPRQDKNAKDDNFRIELLSDEKKEEIDTKRIPRTKQKAILRTEIDSFLISDGSNTVTLNFEPNEPCIFSYSPLFICRPDEFAEPVQVASLSVCALSWDIELAPGMETEKTIMLSVFTKKRKRV